VKAKILVQVWPGVLIQGLLCFSDEVACIVTVVVTAEREKHFSDVV